MIKVGSYHEGSAITVIGKQEQMHMRLIEPVEKREGENNKIERRKRKRI